LHLCCDPCVFLKRFLLVKPDKSGVGFYEPLIEDASRQWLVIIVLDTFDIHRSNARLFSYLANRYSACFAGGFKFFTKRFSHFEGNVAQPAVKFLNEQYIALNRAMSIDWHFGLHPLQP